MKRIAILGSTGQIGTQALEVISHHPDELSVVSLVCNNPSKLFLEQVKKFSPKHAIAASRDGDEAVVAATIDPEVDLVIVAVVGTAGVLPTLEAIRHNKTIALATKEVLVLAGEIIMDEALKYHSSIIPLDSEHSAIFSLINQTKNKEIRNIYITMGEGPIAKMSSEQLSRVTIKDVNNRPKWTMGTKIAVDSATCINKTFEVIEAHWLFGLTPNQIKIVVHPEYLCHSLVEFVDGSIAAEIGTPDMKRYIHYALFYPERKTSGFSSYLDLYGQSLSFKKSPIDKFPCLGFGHRVIAEDKLMPAVLHGADRAAVEAFVNKKAFFTDIPTIITRTLDFFSNQISKKSTILSKEKDVDQKLKIILDIEQSAYIQAQQYLN